MSAAGPLHDLLGLPLRAARRDPTTDTSIGRSLEGPRHRLLATGMGTKERRDRTEMGIETRMVLMRMRESQGRDENL